MFISNLRIFIILSMVIVAMLLPSTSWAGRRVGSGEAYVSTLNSTTTTLDGGATFTGSAEDVARYSQINCFSFSDVASAVNGWTLEFSTDGTNWDRKKSVSTTANQSQAHTLAVVTEYFRVVYINGSAAQSSFRLECIYNTSQSKHLTTSANEIIGGGSDVLLVRNVGSHQLQVAGGIVTGHSLVRVFGHNPAVGSSEEAIWSNGGDYTGFLVTAINIEVLSSDADDDTDGAGNNDGASTVVVFGLDENFLEISESFTMNGTSAVAATVETSWIRVTRASVTLVGTDSTTNPSTTGANVGIITVRVASAGATLATIEAQAGHSELAIYTVPAGKNAFLSHVDINVSVAANKSATVTMWHRHDADDVSTPFPSRRLTQTWEDIDGGAEGDYELSVSFTEKTDIWFSGIRTGSADALVDVQFELHLVPNTALPAAP